VRPTRCNN